MNGFNDFTSSLRGRLPRNLRLWAVVFVLMGELAFVLTQMLPAVLRYGNLSSQLFDARAALGPTVTDAEVEATIQARLAMSEQILAKQAIPFLAESEVPAILNHLYRSAEESGVQIDNIGAAGGAQKPPEEGAVQVIQSFQIEASGASMDLVEFVIRFEEASLPSIVIDNMDIKPGRSTAGGSSLKMEIHIYTSPYASPELEATPLH
jgi:Tfp pilus assembly protein PilO